MNKQERNQKIREYRKTHTGAETAKKFGVSIATVYAVSAQQRARKTKSTTPSNRPWTQFNRKELESSYEQLLGICAVQDATLKLLRNYITQPETAPTFQ